ncbi:MAG TPA: ABC transporter ATP-binding protein [Actinomycetota bacterium]|nr:ABC transporter ATP-binding protein [Actinomycetota bacterium]
MSRPSPTRARATGGDDGAARATAVLHDVTIDYDGPGGSVRAVESLSAEIVANEKFVILGPSGCGKSTLLAALGGFVQLTSGSIVVHGEAVARPSLERVMVFQDFGQLFPWKTVLDNVTFALRRRWPRASRSELAERARRYVELVGLGAQSTQHPHTLSGGQKQRAAIARAFALSPQMLLMDEPFGALDALNRERMQRELNRIWEEERTTIVFVTHDVLEAVHLGHRILVMTPGPGRVREIVRNPTVGAAPTDPAGLEVAARLRALLSDGSP